MRPVSDKKFMNAKKKLENKINSRYIKKLRKGNGNA